MSVNDETILAVASPPGRSPRGIIRLSGLQTYHLLRSRLRFRAGIEPQHWQRGVTTAGLRLGAFELPITLFLMPGPHSYTGEDSAELQLPGNPTLLNRTIESLLNAAKHMGVAARRATAGEFTARAFLNGRISLTQAEGVAAIIAAQSDAELRAAQFLINNSLGVFAHQLADDLANLLALVEAGIDFTDQEDVVAIAPAVLHNRLVTLQQGIAGRLARSIGTEQLQAIPWVVLVGAPNAGKSALFNALLGHERAVVSPISGTTRDVLAEPLSIRTTHGPAEVMLIDLAGADEELGEMNQQMQLSAKRAIERAELILHCVPCNESAATILIAYPSDAILVRTKSDLGNSPLPDDAVSALDGRGLVELKMLIRDRLADRAVSLAADAAALTPRHESALRSAADHVNEAIGLVAPIQDRRTLEYPELVASAMRAGLNDLAALAGDISPDDVLGRVFASFCIGK